LQVLQTGGREPPTKPKGRPRKHDLDKQLDGVSVERPMHD